MKQGETQGVRINFGQYEELAHAFVLSSRENTGKGALNLNIRKCVVSSYHKEVQLVPVRDFIKGRNYYAKQGND